MLVELLHLGLDGDKDGIACVGKTTLRRWRPHGMGERLVRPDYDSHGVLLGCRHLTLQRLSPANQAVPAGQ